MRRWRDKYLIVRITEIEAYVGEDDAASHARFGRTKRNAVMYGQAGHAYVYLIYGMYHCLNIVTERKNYPAAILIRAAVWVETTTNENKIKMLQKKKVSLQGPSRLCRALHITRAQNNENLVDSSKLFVAQDNFTVSDADIKTSVRIGVDYAGVDASLPWRYFISTR